MVLAVVDVDGAVVAGEAHGALAHVVGQVVDAAAAILAGVKALRAEGDLGLAEGAHEALGTAALVRLDQVHAGRVVGALVAHAVVHVALAARAREAGGALAAVGGQRNTKSMSESGAGSNPPGSQLFTPAAAAAALT